jgi:hypothetical protein
LTSSSACRAGPALSPALVRLASTVLKALPPATNLLRYFGNPTALVSNPVAGPAVILAFARQRLTGVIPLTIDGEQIKKIHVIADPAKVGFLSAQPGTSLPAGAVGVDGGSGAARARSGESKASHRT